MKKLLLLTALLVFFFALPAQPVGDTARSNLSRPVWDDAIFKFGRVNILKASPVFYGISIKGASLSHETGINWWPFSLNTTLRYFSGTDSTDGSVTIPENLMLELQPRFWGIKYLNGIFLAPFVNFYSTGDIGFGGLFGYQFFLSNRLSMETSVGIQSSNNTDNYNSPIFLRYGLSFGFAFPKGIKRNGN